MGDTRNTIGKRTLRKKKENRRITMNKWNRSTIDSMPISRQFQPILMVVLSLIVKWKKEY